MTAHGKDKTTVIFDDLAFTEDLRRSGANGRAVARAARNTFERDGCPVNDLLACENEATDGTRLEK